MFAPMFRDSSLMTFADLVCGFDFAILGLQFGVGESNASTGTRPQIA